MIARALFAALLLAALALPAFAQDTGELASEEELMTLGPDVEATVGPPAHAPRTGALLDEVTDDIASRVRCPVCQGMAVSDSPSESARNMKHQVRALVAAGYDEAQILAYFESSYGEFIRLEPTKSGFNLVVWVLPGLMLVLGLLYVARFVSGMRGSPEAPPEAPTAGDDHEDPWIAQVRKELADG